MPWHFSSQKKKEIKIELPWCHISAISELSNQNSTHIYPSKNCNRKKSYVCSMYPVQSFLNVFANLPAPQPTAVPQTAITPVVCRFARPSAPPPAARGTAARSVWRAASVTRDTCSTARAASCLKTVAATLMASTTRSVSHPARHGMNSR